MNQDYSESLRPQFHFTAKTGWLNDPNGLVYYKGNYHMFFQHNPSGTEWGNMTWGHATSPDLIHWTQVPNAIEPDEDGTVFSGSAVVDWHNSTGFQAGKDPAMVAIYTCAGDTSPESKGKPYTQNLACSTDGGKTWHKYSGNPILPQVAPGNRDPKVCRYEPKQEWVMALYFEGNDFGIFTSRDLKSWTQTQRFRFDGADECPDFFELPVEGTSERRWVYTSASGRYLVGTFDGAEFKPDQAPLEMDQGPNFYAVQTYSDISPRDGRRIQVAWMRGGEYADMPFNQQMGFPCKLTLHRNGSAFLIHREPVKEIAKIRGASLSRGSQALTPSDDVLDGLIGDLWDLEFDVEIGTAERVVLSVRGRTFEYVVDAQTLIDGDREVRLEAANGHLRVRALIDRTSVELFANAGAFSYSACHVPKDDNHRLSLTVQGGSAKLKSLKLWPLASAW